MPLEMKAIGEAIDFVEHALSPLVDGEVEAQLENDEADLVFYVPIRRPLTQDETNSLDRRFEGLIGFLVGEADIEVIVVFLLYKGKRVHTWMRFGYEFRNI